MKTFWNDLLCGLIGHPGTWVAELDDATFTTSTNPPIGAGIRYGITGAVMQPWRCSRCRRTLAEIRDDYSVKPDWLKKLGW